MQYKSGHIVECEVNAIWHEARDVRYSLQSRRYMFALWGTTQKWIYLTKQSKWRTSSQGIDKDQSVRFSSHKDNAVAINGSLEGRPQAIMVQRLFQRTCKTNHKVGPTFDLRVARSNSCMLGQDRRCLPYTIKMSIFHTLLTQLAQCCQ